MTIVETRPGPGGPLDGRMRGDGRVGGEGGRVGEGRGPDGVGAEVGYGGEGGDGGYHDDGAPAVLRGQRARWQAAHYVRGAAGR
jgi:hypothetical protein